jgi:hypothetical protein
MDSRRLRTADALDAQAVERISRTSAIEVRVVTISKMRRGLRLLERTRRRRGVPLPGPGDVMNVGGRLLVVKVRRQREEPGADSRDPDTGGSLLHANTSSRKFSTDLFISGIRQFSKIDRWGNARPAKPSGKSPLNHCTGRSRNAVLKQFFDPFHDPPVIRSLRF